MLPFFASSPPAHHLFNCLFSDLLLMSALALIRQVVYADFGLPVFAVLRIQILSAVFRHESEMSDRWYVTTQIRAGNTFVCRLKEIDFRRTKNIFQSANLELQIWLDWKI